MKMAYGYDIRDENDFFIGVAEEAAQISGYALAPGRWMVDYFPLCEYFHSMSVASSFLIVHYSALRPVVVPWCSFQAPGRSMENKTAGSIRRPTSLG